MHLLVPIAANIALGIVLLAIFLAHRTVDDVRLTDSEAALRLFRVRFPDADGTVTLADDRRGALIQLRHGTGVGLLQRRGRRWTARELAVGDLRSVTLTAGATISLALADFGWPRANLEIADPEARAAWLGRLESLAASGAKRGTAVTTHA